MDTHRPPAAELRSRTVAIVGAGFSGAAVAVRLLRDPPPFPCRIVLVERSARFGCGLAYSGDYAGAQLNVPAARMSIDERQPEDFREYLRTRGILAWPDEFISRTLYGDYLEARLTDAARAAPVRVRLELVNAEADGLARAAAGGPWQVHLHDGRSVLADSVVLATGHFRPRTPEALRDVADSDLYCNDPWRRRVPAPAGGRVLLIGTGLTMADVANDLAADPRPPRDMLAISRRGLLALTRREAAPNAPTVDVGLDELARQTTLRGLVRAVRHSVDRAADAGIDWRDVMVGLRERVPALWHRLGTQDRARFLRHLQPYWDVHRHQLPPRVGLALHSLISAGQLRVRAARIASASETGGRIVVGLRLRGHGAIVQQAYDRVINCSGPDADPARASSPLVQSLLAQGLIRRDPTGVGIDVDAQSRAVGADGRPVDGLYYLGPWLRARDLEATAVHELRLHATAVADRLRRGPQSAGLEPDGSRAAGWR